MASFGKSGKPVQIQTRIIIFKCLYFATEAVRLIKNGDKNRRITNATFLEISRITLNNIINKVSSETYSTAIKFSTTKKGRLTNSK